MCSVSYLAGSVSDRLPRPIARPPHRQHYTVASDRGAVAASLASDYWVKDRPYLDGLRAIAVYVDVASFVINELKQVGVEPTLRPVETAQWHPMATRGDYQIGATLTGLGVDDPDANFCENFACGSPRNHSPCCT